jgi:hypothetical protein
MAEGTQRARQGNAEVTVRRFGWSDLSQGDAIGIADGRVEKRCSASRWRRTSRT